MGGDIVSQLRTIAKEKQPPSTVIKKFQILVSEKEQDIAREIDTILGNLHPQTNLEQLLKCRLIDQFKVSSEVISLLQSCESLKVNQAMKCKWFFMELQDPEGFVRDIIPTLSLSTRLKVINKYATLLKNTKSGEILYLGIKSRYGLRAASALLPACGENLIRNELPSVKFSLDPNVVTALLGKYPALTTEYLKYLADEKSHKPKRQDLSKYDQALLKLSNQDFKSFLSLYENHSNNFPYLKLGRRATKKLIKEESDKVLNDYSKFKQILDEKIFFHRLSLDQLKKIYMKDFLPQEVSSILSSSMRRERLILKCIRESLHTPFLLSTVSAKYGRNFTDEDILFKLSEVWIDYMPEDARMKWVEMKVKESNDVGDQASYLANLPVSISIPRLKKLIESQSDPEMRQKIAEYMIDSIRINHSVSSIKSLFEYFNQRFRNETDRFLGRILSKMRTLGPLYLLLETEDWAPMLELFNVLRIRNIFDDNIYDVGPLLSQRLHNSFLKQGNVESILEETCELLGCGPTFMQLCQGTPFRGNVLSLMLRLFEGPKYEKDRQNSTFCVELLGVLCNHLSSKGNEDPKVQVDIPKWIFSWIDLNLEARPVTQDTSHLLNRCMKHLKTLPDKTLWLSYAEKFISSYPSDNQELHSGDLILLVQKKPDFVLHKISDILTTARATSDALSPFYKICRLYDSYGLSTEITRTFLGMISDPDIRPHAIRVLSILLPPSEYINTVSPYTPTVTKIDTYTDDVKQLYDTQKEICKSFVDVPNPCITLPLIKEFAVGDYLKLVVGSFVSACIKVPENEILKVLNEFMDCPVSLRKHLLRMTILIAPTEQKISTITGVFQKERNVSLRLVIFNLLRKAFFDEPDDETFKIFSSTISQLTAEDTEALKLVFDISQLDDAYIPQYLELIWILAGSAWQNALPDGKSKIVNLVDRHLLREMKEDFCDMLLQYEFSRTLPNSLPGNFVSMYLVHSPTHETQATRLNKVLEALNPLITSSWNNHNFKQEGHVFPVRYIIKDFIDHVCLETAFDCHLSPTQLLNELKKRILSINPDHTLEERLKLELAIASPSFGDAADVSALVDLYKQYAERYSPQYATEIIDILVNNAPQKWRQELASELITLDETNPLCQIVGIKLLSTHVSEKSDELLFEKLVKILLASRDSNVQAAAHKFFRDLTTSLI